MVLILDNYDSFTYNLVHIIAEETSDYKVFRNDALSVDEVKKMSPSSILISPGPGRPENAGITQELIQECGPKVPILGICLGHQAIGNVYGADVVHAPSLMHGKTSIIEHNGTGIYHDVPQHFTATRYHSLVLRPESVPDVLEITCRTPDGVIMGVRHKQFPIEGIQFHPESILTTEGPRLVKNWLNQQLKPA
ncbi:MAG: aminodeoxychorismate/anthranilate synthase component II [Balneolales bacterium]|nr:aminodeoxychorismate/anthranilate synthase component II [Balneolales bacterium]